jgi:glycosyltransferase involved in cell wall biosynthesis
LRILQVIPVFYPAQVFGGAADVVYCISKELARKGHDVEVYTTNALDNKKNFMTTSQEQTMAGFKVKYFKNIWRPQGLYFSPGIISTFRKEISSFDVVHIHAWRQFWQDIISHHYAFKNKVPYVLQVHGGLLRINTRQNVKLVFDQFFGYRILKDASGVIALTQKEANQYHQFGVPTDKISLVPNGIDLSAYDCLPIKGFFKKRFHLCDEEQIVLYLGRISPEKGIDFLIHAFAVLLKGYNGRLRLVIAGPDDGYLRQLVALVTSLGISNSVLFTGLLSSNEKVSAYVDASIVVNVEPKNVYGLVPLEAAACSTPVIVSTGNAIFEIIEKGNFGFAVQYGDTTQLSNIMSRILNDPELRLIMGENGRKFVMQNFSWKKAIDKLEATYYDLL